MGNVCFLRSPLQPVNCIRDLVPGTGFPVPGTRYLVLRLNSYQIPADININFPAPGARYQIPGFRWYLVPGTRYQARTRHLVPSTWYLDVPGTGTRYMVAGVRHQVLVAGTWCLGTRYLVSTWFQVPGTGA